MHSTLTAALALAATAYALPTTKTLAPRMTVSADPVNLCGMPDDSQVIPNTPWIAYNMMYAASTITGTACTGFSSISTWPGNGVQNIHWNASWDMPEASNPDTVKGYSFVGLTQNLENRLSDISSIPSHYHWIRTNETAYKGNVVYDFMTSDTKGDSTSSSAQELMLWLRYEGGQLPIGYASGAVATIQLYGKSWTLYQGKNTDTGITVSSLLVDQDDQYIGDFRGDIKEWLVAMSKQNIFSESTYVNVGNAGMEPFWGTVNFVNTLSLKIEL